MARPPRQVNETHIDIEAGCSNKSTPAVVESCFASASKDSYFGVLQDLVVESCFASASKGGYLLWGSSRSWKEPRGTLGKLVQPVRDSAAKRLSRSQRSRRLQNPLIKEYALNLTRVPTIISGIFLN